ncbi:unnamed protein product, partial [Closterium sp. Yama58-4]
MDAPNDAVLHHSLPLFNPSPPTLFTLCLATLPRWRNASPPRKPTSLKNPSMDALDDVALRLAQLALSCTVERTASQSSMANIANKLQGIRHEVVAKEELSAAIKVDEEATEMGIGMSFE